MTSHQRKNPIQRLFQTKKHPVKLRLFTIKIILHEFSVCWTIERIRGRHTPHNMHIKNLSILYIFAWCVCMHACVCMSVWCLIFIEEPVNWLSTRGVILLLLLLLYLHCACRVTIFTYALSFSLSFFLKLFFFCLSVCTCINVCVSVCLSFNISVSVWPIRIGIKLCMNNSAKDEKYN